MQSRDQEAKPVEGETALPPRTTPTWDMELLISGATIFGLMQVPVPLNAFLVSAIDKSDASLADNIRLFGIYAQFALVLLIGTFILHLTLRAYWVAMVGMRSVYPDGIDWSKTGKTGPIHQSENLRIGPTLEVAIERADNTATKVFGVGLSFAVPMSVIAMLFGVFIGLGWMLQVAGVNERLIEIMTRSLSALLIVPFFLMVFIDSAMGNWLIKTGRDQWVRRVYGWFHKLGIGPGTNPLFAVVSSQMGANRVAFLMIGLLIPTSVATVIFMQSALGGIDNGAYDALPRNELGSSHNIRTDHYQSLREPDSKLDLPLLPDIVIKGDYLRVFVPYWPRRHNEVLMKQCPQAMTKTAQAKGEGLACLLQYLDPKIDSKPRAVDIFGGDSPLNDNRGAWLIINISDLAKGQHELTLHAPPPKRKKVTDIALHRIVFWR